MIRVFRSRRIRASWVLLWAATLEAQSPGEANALLTRARERIATIVDHLPRYTCTQTIHRSYFRQTRRTGRNCDDIIADRSRGRSKLELIATDRVRLEVEVDDSGNEIYAWPGAAHVGSMNIEDLIGGGPIGTGSFGSFLVDVFENPGTELMYRQPRMIDGQRALEYRYRVPLKASHYQLMDGPLLRVIAYDGTFWVDAESAELRRLTVRTSELPKDSESCEATTTIDFGHRQIGAGNYLLPRASLLEYVFMDASESENANAWSGCHEFRGEAALSFNTSDCGVIEHGQVCASGTAKAQSSGSEGAGEGAMRSLPPGLPVLLDLDSEVDTAVVAAGDSITAKLRTNVMDPRSKRVLAPAGAIVRGRIRHIEHHIRPSYYILTISFENIELGDHSIPFAAILDHPAQILDSGMQFLAHPDIALFQSHARGWGSGTFIFRSRQKKFVVPRGYESKWLTVVPSAE